MVITDSAQKICPNLMICVWDKTNSVVEGSMSIYLLSGRRELNAETVIAQCLGPPFFAASIYILQRRHWLLPGLEGPIGESLNIMLTFTFLRRWPGYWQLLCAEQNISQLLYKRNILITSAAVKYTISSLFIFSTFHRILWAIAHMEEKWID